MKLYTKVISTKKLAYLDFNKSILLFLLFVLCYFFCLSLYFFKRHSKQPSQTTILSSTRSIFRHSFSNPSIRAAVRPSSIHTYMYMSVCLSAVHLFQVKFDGHTGKVRFDENGFRDEFTLHLYDITMTMGLAEVRE